MLVSGPECSDDPRIEPKLYGKWALSAAIQCDKWDCLYENRAKLNKLLLKEASVVRLNQIA